MAEQAPRSGEGGQPRRVAVVVVHGVGDAEPGVALNEIVDTLQKQYPDDIQAKRYCEVHPLSAMPAVTGDAVDRFPACARGATLTATGDEVRFYDLHWADLTRAAPGRLNTLLGAFHIIFESHHFVDAMLPREGGPVVRVLRSLLIWAAAILRGPIVGLSACLVAVGFAFYFTRNYMIRFAGGNAAHLHEFTAEVFWLAVLAVMAASVIALYLRRQRTETEWKDVLVAMALGSALLVAYGAFLYFGSRGRPVDFALVAAGEEEPPMCLYVTRLYYLIQNLRVVWCALVGVALLLIGLLALGVWRPSNSVRPGAAMAATSVVVLQSALWLSLISAVSIPLIHQASLHQRLREGASGNSCELESLYVSFLGTALLLAFATFAALVTYATRYLLARTGSRMMPLERRARLMPRMLFGGLITTIIIIFGALQVAVFAAVYVNDVINNQFMSGFAKGLGSLIVGWLPWELDVTELVERLATNKFSFYGIAAGAAALVSTLAVMGFTTAIHVTRDLINHQYNPRLGYSYYLLPQFLYTRRHGLNMDRPRRARIRERLDTLAREVICQPPSFTDLVFIAHSQGSVIVYDYLRAGGDQCNQLLCVRAHLVTFGSPLGHLYQHYFKEYGDLGRDIDEVGRRQASWTNVYRVDDYVGRRIVDRAGLIQNKVLPAGGHVNYWTQAELCEIILDRIRTPAGAAPRPAQASQGSPVA